MFLESCACEFPLGTNVTMSRCCFRFDVVAGCLNTTQIPQTDNNFLLCRRSQPTGGVKAGGNPSTNRRGRSVTLPLTHIAVFCRRRRRNPHKWNSRLRRSRRQPEGEEEEERTARKIPLSRSQSRKIPCRKFPL